MRAAEKARSGGDARSAVGPTCEGDTVAVAAQRGFASMALQAQIAAAVIMTEELRGHSAKRHLENMEAEMRQGR